MTFRTKARRAGWLLVIAAFAFGIVSAIRPAPTSAYGLISSRSIEMSSNDASGASGSGLGTNVIYKVGFTLATAGQTVGSVVIHFCQNDPVIGDACTAPTGMDVNKATTQIYNFSSGGNVNWTTAPTIDTTDSQSNILVLNRSSATTVSGTPTITFELGNGTTNGITNPSLNETFYARIMIFTNTSPAFTSPESASNSTLEKSVNVTDAGGVAMSTANVLNVTAKVQEQLTFCVHTGNLCTDGGNAVKLGDANNVLYNTNQNYLDATPKFDIASNALGGVMVRLKGDTLKSGTFSITPDGNTCTPDLTTTSGEQFGVRVVSYGTGMANPGATDAVANTPVDPNDDFDCTAGNHKFDPTRTNTTYGQNFVKTLGATDLSTTNFEIAAKASSTTEAGVYTTKLELIATATY